MQTEQEYLAEYAELTMYGLAAIRAHFGPVRLADGNFVMQGLKA